MRQLWLYDWLSKLTFLSYRAKIMVIAFIGTHIPLLAIIGFLIVEGVENQHKWLTLAGTALFATLAGTALTLFLLHHLMAPVPLTSMALELYRRARRQLTLPTCYADEMGVLMRDTASAISYLENVRKRLEFIDEATLLPNRRGFVQQLDARMRLNEPFAVVALRLLDFDELRGLRGAEGALQALRDMAGQLRHALKPLAGPARIGDATLGFVISAGQPQRAGRDGRSRRMQELREVMASTTQAMRKAGGVPVPSPVLGVVFYPDDSPDGEDLLHRAISTAAHGNGQMPVLAYDERIRVESGERLQLEHELALALEHNQFELHLQPLVDVEAARVVGAEGLIRWHHPQRGLLKAGEFIGAAESSGHIVPIGRWVFKQAVRQIQRWDEQGLSHLRLSINVSVRQFQSDELIDLVEDAIENSNINPDRLELEVTETAAMTDRAQVSAILHRLRVLGVGVAIDDFGTGYASVSTLQTLPADQLKIDREFVSDVVSEPTSQAICKAIVGLSRGLRMNVLAEGAETFEQVRYLAANGCRFFQGYWFGEPMPAQEFSEHLRSVALGARLAVLNGIAQSAD